MIRSGRIDVTVLGAYEVADNGDFANWKMAGQKGGGHRRRDGSGGPAPSMSISPWSTTRATASRAWSNAAPIPVTARGVVDLVVTNLGLFELTPNGFLLREIAPGVSVDMVKSSTGGPPRRARQPADGSDK